MSLERKVEERCLLPPEVVTSTSIENVDSMSRKKDLHSISSSSNDEDEDDSDIEAEWNDCQLKSSSVSTKIPLQKIRRLKNSKHRRRHQIHRGARRFVRLLICVMLMPVILIMFYLPLYSTIHTRQVALPDWGRNTSRNIAEYILPDNDTSLLEPRHLCKTRDKFFLLIVICSELKNFAARENIRKTWGNTTEFNYGMFFQLHAHLRGQYLDPNTTRLRLYNEYIGLSKNQTINNATIIPLRFVFFVGRNKPTTPFEDELTAIRIKNESEKYQDIIQEDFIDTYNNLTLKSVLVLKWVTRHCLHKSAFVMKCDDDTFVNVPNLLQYLLGGTIPLYNDTLELYNARTYNVLSPSNRLTRTKNYLAGYLFCTTKPVSILSSKWYMPYDMYPNDKYPKYLSGSAYIMSIDVVSQLYEVSLNTTLIYLEDVYVTGICAEKLNIPRLHQPLFSYIRRQKLCSLKGSITQHDMKGDRLAEAYTFVMNLTNQCAPPGNIFKYSPLRRISDCG